MQNLFTSFRLNSLKKTKNIVSVLLLGLLVFMNVSCGGDATNPMVNLNDPSTLPGSYKLVAITDKTGEDLPEGFTIQADQPITVTVEGVTLTITVSGTLTLTENRYTFSITIKISIPDFPEQTETETDTGTYSLNGSTITFESEDPENGKMTFNISAQGRQITLENDEGKLVFEKQ